MFVRKLTILTLLLFSAQFLVFSQKILEGNALSSSVEESLSKNGFTVYAQQLTQSGQDEFAYNLLINFPATKADENYSESKTERTQIVFCFRQEDFFAHSEDIFDFLLFLKDSERTWEAEILFSVLDESVFKNKESTKGTEVFALSLDDADRTAARPAVSIAVLIMCMLFVFMIRILLYVYSFFEWQIAKRRA